MVNRVSWMLCMCACVLIYMCACVIFGVGILDREVYVMRERAR